MVNKFVILLLSVLLIGSLGLATYFYFQLRDCKDKYVEGDTKIYIKPGTAKIEDNYIDYTVPARKIKQRKNTLSLKDSAIAWNINEAALDAAIERGGLFAIDSLPEFYTALHDTLVEKNLVIITSFGNELTPLFDTVLTVQNAISLKYHHPEALFSFAIKQNFDTLHINYLQKEIFYEKKLLWYQTETFNWIVRGVCFIAGTTFGVIIMEKRNAQTQ